MISFFRRLLPSRLVALVLLYLAIRVPLLLLGIPDTVPQLRAMLIGERLAEGFVLYRDIFDTMAPLSAMVYWLIDLVAGRSALVHQGLAGFLVLFQGLRLNTIFSNNGVYPEKSMLPALLYVTMGSIFFELDVLSPLLIGNTFVVLALGYLTSISKGAYNTRKLFKAGFMIGLAALSYLPFLFFLLVGAFAILFYASNAFRSFLLLLCGFAFPYAVAATYYLYTGALSQFIEFNLISSWRFRLDFLLEPSGLLRIWAAPLLLLLLAFYRLTSITMGLNYQAKFQQLMFVWLVAAMLVAFSGQVVSAATLLLFLPAIAYFGTFFFQRKKPIRVWVTEGVFVVLLLAVVTIRYSYPLGIQPYVGIDSSPLEVDQQPRHDVIQQARILVLGENLPYYTHNQLATPYLNWDLAQDHFGQLDQYDAVFRIYRHFAKEQPEYIVDEAGLMEELQYKVPGIFGQYERTGDSQIYRRVGRQ
jgi:hypothetical protein